MTLRKRRGPQKRSNYPMMTMRDEYVHSPDGKDEVTLEFLAKKYHCSLKHVKTVSSRDGWVDQRAKWRTKGGQIGDLKSANKVAANRAKLASGALMMAMMIPAKYRPLVEKMQKAPAKDWMNEPEILKLSPSDYEKLIKVWLLLNGQADSHIEITDRDKRMAAAYWKAHLDLMEKDVEG